VPSLGTGSVPCLRIAPVADVPVVLTFPNGVLFQERAQSPTRQGAIGGSRRSKGQFSLCGAFHRQISNQLTCQLYHPCQIAFVRPAVMPAVPLSDDRVLFFDRGLVLLRHKVLYFAGFLIGAAQHGHRGKFLTRARTSRRRMVAIEFGMCRSGRSGGASGSVTLGNGRRLEHRGGTRC